MCLKPFIVTADVAKLTLVQRESSQADESEIEMAGQLPEDVIAGVCPVERIAGASSQVRFIDRVAHARVNVVRRIADAYSC